MELFALVAGSNQVVTVTDSQSRANRLRDLLAIELPSTEVRVEPTDSFYPDGYVDGPFHVLEAYKRIRSLA